MQPTSSSGEAPSQNPGASAGPEVPRISSQQQVQQQQQQSAQPPQQQKIAESDASKAVPVHPVAVPGKGNDRNLSRQRNDPKFHGQHFGGHHAPKGNFTRQHMKHGRGQ